MRSIYIRDEETMRKNMRRPLLLHKALTDHIHGKSKMQPIMSQMIKQPQHMLFIRQPSVKHEISIVTSSEIVSLCYYCKSFLEF